MKNKSIIKWQKVTNNKFDILFQLSICNELYEIANPKALSESEFSQSLSSIRSFLDNRGH